MSGIVGVFNVDGAPVDRDVAQRLTDVMAYRGPDRQSLRIDGAVGLGHTLLTTTDEDHYGPQPFSLDGSVWIVADARVDARRELRAALGASDTAARALDLSTTSDVELLLRAYLTWGEDCPRRLLGDFSFIVWDGRRRTVFCARDPFGVKLLYYARVGPSLIVSNTLHCIRHHPLVSARLNERSMGDFLLFRTNHDPDTTAFADIQRVPAAHSLQARDLLVRLCRYHTFPVRTKIHHRRASEYVDRFREVMDLAVGDRLRTKKMMILMSGGLDSTALAATAVDVAAARGQSLDLQALTGVFTRVTADDREGRFAEIAAAALGIPHRQYVADAAPLRESWGRLDLQGPEPLCYLITIAAMTLRQPLVTDDRRVVLFGHGADLAFNTDMRGYSARDLLAQTAIGDALLDVAHSVRPAHQIPPLGTNLRRAMRNLRSPRRDEATPTRFPAWVNDDFARRLNLHDRWEGERRALPAPTHNLHYAIYDGFLSPYEMAVHEWYDPGVPHLPMEVWFPYLDLRVVDVLLSLPVIPWVIKKAFLRVAMRDRLPDEIVRRPKTNMSVQPFPAVIGARQEDVLRALGAMPELEPYINLDGLAGDPAPTGIMPGWTFPAGVSVASLGNWLRSVERA